MYTIHRNDFKSEEMYVYDSQSRLFCEVLEVLKWRNAEKPIRPHRFAP
jgi:hypothetical protein